MGSHDVSQLPPAISNTIFIDKLERALDVFANHIRISSRIVHNACSRPSTILDPSSVPAIQTLDGFQLESQEGINRMLSAIKQLQSLQANGRVIRNHLTSSAAKLPDVVLREIFLIGSLDSGRLFDRIQWSLLVSQVCNHWRETALGLGYLWSTVSTAWPPEYQNIWLCRTNKHKTGMSVYHKIRHHLPALPRTGELSGSGIFGSELTWKEVELSLDDNSDAALSAARTWLSASRGHFARTLLRVTCAASTSHYESIRAGFNIIQASSIPLSMHSTVSNAKSAASIAELDIGDLPPHSLGCHLIGVRNLRCHAPWRFNGVREMMVL